MDLSLYIHSEYYLLVIALYGIGAFLKSHTKLPNWCIPTSLSILGVLSACGVQFLIGNPITFDICVQGFICGVTAVGTNQIFKQTVQNAGSNKIIVSVTEDEIDKEEEIEEQDLTVIKQEEEKVEEIKPDENGAFG